MKKPEDRKKKKRTRVRTKDWEEGHEFSFTHDRIRHRRAKFAVSEVATEIKTLPHDFKPNATVISHSKKWAFVMMDDQEILARIDERLIEREATLLAPGDNVFLERPAETTDAEYVVLGIAPRRTKLCRPAGPEARLVEQVFAANIDALIVVAAAADPPFKAGLVDRYLIAAEMGGVEPLLCVNKMDLVTQEPKELAGYRDLGVTVITTSCTSGQGLDTLRDALRGKLSVLSGHSGVGKSSLLNVLDPALEIHTREVSEASQRGRHTTTAARLYEIDGDIRIIDTPGIRSLGLWEVSAEEVAYYFPEIAEVGAACRFRNCTHTHEPKCAVLEAVQEGNVLKGRYESYLRIRASLESDTGTTPGRIAPQHRDE